MIRSRHLAVAALLVAGGCFSMIPKKSGTHVKAPASRPIDAADIALTRGYQIEPIAAGLTYPTGITFDDQGKLYAVESGYSYGEDFTTPRLMRIEDDGRITPIATGGDDGPWNGVTFDDGAFFVAAGGAKTGGHLLRIARDGKITVLVDQLPTGGDHHTDGPAVGPDGNIYFGTGTMTNSGVVGPDDAEFGWLRRSPSWHDVPCRDVTLTGENFDSDDVLKGSDRATTGAFVPFGTPTQKGQVIPGAVPCSGAVMRVSPSGGTPELVGWGFRNPYGLTFTTDGKLLVTDNGYDTRGSRPVWGAADWLWVVDPSKPPIWHGWPERADGRDVTLARYKGPSKRPPPRLLATYPNEPPAPAALFACHSSSNGLDVSKSDRFGFVGQAFVAQFGDTAPVAGKVIGPVGFKVVRVNLANGVIEEFAVNRGKQNGPASFLKSGGLERPLAVKFSPDGSALYVVDFGILTTDGGEHPKEGTGVIWKITRAEGR